mgnify:CR=1 FL=1
MYIFSDSMAKWDTQLLQHLSTAYAPGSAKNLRSHWRLYLAFCIDNQLVIFPPQYSNISRFYMYLLSRIKAYVSLSNYQSSIATFYKAYGFQLDTSDIIFKLFNMAAKKTLNTVPSPKLPLEYHHLLQFLRVADMSNPFHMTFISAVVTGFFGLLRRSNICPPSVLQFDHHKHLTRSDIDISPTSLVVNLRWTKTNQHGDKVFKVPIASFPGSPLDPPVLFAAFNDTLRVFPQDPCFSFYLHGRHYVLTHQDLAHMLKSFLHAIGVDAAGYASHSIRRGGATLFHMAGVPSLDIQAHGTWQSDAYRRYVDVPLRDRFRPTKRVFSYLADVNRQVSNK